MRPVCGDDLQASCFKLQVVFASALDPKTQFNHPTLLFFSIQLSIYVHVYISGFVRFGLCQDLPNQC